MKDVEHICFYCSNSCVTDDDELFCVKNKKIVDDEDTCEDYN